MPVPISGKGATVLVSLPVGYVAEAIEVTAVFKFRECAAADGSSIIGAGGAACCGAGAGTGAGTGVAMGTGARAAFKLSRSLSRTDFARICQVLAIAQI